MPTQDLHLHTHLSFCAPRNSYASDFIEHAKEIKLNTIAFTDHMWDNKVPGASSWYAPQDYEHICQLKGELDDYRKNHDTGNLKILFGCETDCIKNGTIGISRETASELDVVLVPNSHTHMTDFVIPEEYKLSDRRHADYMVRQFLIIVNSPISDLITAVPHPFNAVGAKNHEELVNLISDSDFIDCFKSARDADIAIEINTSVFGNMTPDHLAECAYIRMFTLARECGCKFTVGSDSHHVNSTRTLPAADEIMKICKITPDDLLKF